MPACAAADHKQKLLSLTCSMPPCYKHNIFESSVDLLSADPVLEVSVQVVVALLCIIVFSNAIISVWFTDDVKLSCKGCIQRNQHVTYKQIDLYASFWKTPQLLGRDLDRISS